MKKVKDLEKNISNTISVNDTYTEKQMFLSTNVVLIAPYHISSTLEEFKSHVKVTEGNQNLYKFSWKNDFLKISF